MNCFIEIITVRQLSTKTHFNPNRPWNVNFNLFTNCAELRSSCFITYVILKSIYSWFILFSLPFPVWIWQRMIILFIGRLVLIFLLTQAKVQSHQENYEFPQVLR